MATLRVTLTVARLITDALKRLPIAQTREQFVEDAVKHYVASLQRKKYQIK